VGPSNDRADRSETQARGVRSRREPRLRWCLLKGCDNRFVPWRPQERYCSAGCVAAAREWSRWKARRGYRRRPRGLESRRRSHKAYRLRRARREAASEASGTEPLPSWLRSPRCRRGGRRRRGWCSWGGGLRGRRGGAGADGATVQRVSDGLGGAGISSRGSSLSAAGGISCDRPGCYDLFCPTARSPKQRFCAKSCRCAMERVWQRERRWRSRHGPGSPRARVGPPSH